MSSAKILTTSYVPPRYLAEATELLALMTCGQKRGYHVRGAYSMHHKGSYEPLRDSLAIDNWLPARFLRERTAEDPDLPLMVSEPRILSAHTVANHLAGKGWVGVSPPSWTSWFAFDIDLAKGPSGKALGAEEAQRRCDAVLSAVWWAFDFGTGRLPVVLRTPGGGYHVYVPLARSEDNERNTWPAHVIRERVMARLRASGLRLRDGELELWPSGKILRLPMGRQMCLLEPQNPDDPDCLGLVPVHARFGPRKDSRTGESSSTLRREIGAGVRAFVEAFEAARRPMAEWLLDDEADWSSKYGPFGDVPPSQNEKNQSFTCRVPNVSQQYEEGNSSDGGHLLKGEFFRRRISKLLRTGLTVAGGRHDAALKLTYYFGVNLGLGEYASQQALSNWLGEFDHVSSFRAQHGQEKFLLQTLREARHYYRNVVAYVGGGRERRGLPLGLPLGDDADVFANQFSSPAVEEAALSILRFLKGYGNSEGMVCEPTELAGTLLRMLCGERRVLVTRPEGGKRRVRAAQLAIEELTTLGILTLYKNYRPDHYGRHFCCWFQFGGGALPSSTAEGKRVLESVEIDEGVLVLTSAGVPLARATSDVVPGGTCVKTPGWVRRMYERHNFAPGDLLGDLSRHIGLFRDYFALEQEVQSHDDEQQERETGVVVSFGDDAGYGFIASEHGGPDLFVHQTSICVDGFRELRLGERVEFTRAAGGKGPKALWVRPLGSDPPSGLSPMNSNLVNKNNILGGSYLAT
jgi:CspA family cold shock protein